MFLIAMAVTLAAPLTDRGCIDLSHEQFLQREIDNGHLVCVGRRWWWIESDGRMLEFFYEEDVTNE